MTSPDTTPPAPQRGIFVVGDGSWKAILPSATVLGVFLAFLVGMLAWFDIRIDGVERRLTAQIGGVKTDLVNRIDQVETGLNARIDGVEKRIDRVEKRLTDRIDEVKVELGRRIDGVKSDLAAGEAKREAAEARQSAAMERLTSGIAENRANHRELLGFVRARFPGAPQPAPAAPEPSPAQ